MLCTVIHDWGVGSDPSSGRLGRPAPVFFLISHHVAEPMESRMISFWGTIRDAESQALP